MPEKNKILPPLELSTEERILKIISDGKPFTIQSIRKKFRPRRPSHRVVSYHVDKMWRNLQIERLPHSGFRSEPFTYILKDGLKDIEEKAPDNGPSAEAIRELIRIVMNLREGQVVNQADIDLIKQNLKEDLDSYTEELRILEALYYCTDLWKIKTLVNRMGFPE